MTERKQPLGRRRTPSGAKRLATPRRQGDARGQLDNAGLVLVAPYLPPLFERLDLLADGGAEWRSPAAAGRAVHLLQYLVDGRCDNSASTLALNKLLCGRRADDPVPEWIELSGHEREVCESLLEALVANWPSIQGNSPLALQESFLQRNGTLVRGGDGGWRVHVERKAIDVLVDNVPWSFSIILHRWMEEPVGVVW